MNKRSTQLHEWLNSLFSEQTWQLTPLAGDASFRRYFRLDDMEQSYIVMDAPPEQENCYSFTAIAKTLAQKNIPVPDIIAENIDAGFLVLTDFGDKDYLDVLNDSNAEQLYGKAFDNLLALQSIAKIDDYALPNFDQDFALLELKRFEEWYLKQYLKITPTADQETILQKIYLILLENIQQQPQLFIHRDYHSRNIMYVDENQIGLLDFQDAMIGPITYDLVSLLRDCYIDWSPKRVNAWALTYLNTLREKHLLNVSDEQFFRWFDLTGLQRHLKVLGIFSRLYLRDNKSYFLNDIPRILNYIHFVTEKYEDLTPLREFFAGIKTQ